MPSENRTPPQNRPQANDQDRVDLLVQYTAALNPRGVRQLIYRHGYNPSHTANLPAFLLAFLRQGGEAALDEFLIIHPDRDLILDSLPAAPTQPIQPALSLFDGPVATTSPVGGTLASQLAELINKQKKGVVDVLNRHGAAVLYDDAAQVVAREAIKALQLDNPVLVRELAALSASAPTFSASYDQARTAGQLAPGATSLVGDVDVSLAPDTDAIARAKRRLGFALAAVLLLLGVLVFMHVKGQRA